VISQITSIGGQIGVPLFSIYCASKWAVEGFTEAISKELKPEWGIKVQCIEPGGFRCVKFFQYQTLLTKNFAGLTGPVDRWLSRKKGIQLMITLTRKQ
jgi:short-subunit dehydrogenase